MRYAAALTLSAFLAMTPVLASAQQAAKPFTDDQKAAIEDIVKQYLTKDHPEVIMQAAQEMQRRDQASADEKAQNAVKNSKDKLFNNPDTPVGGNAKGDVNIVEFFDFNCGYCKMSEEATEKLLKDDGNIKFFYKDFPILGPVSKTASRAALASVAQGKYVKFHDALMAKKEHLGADDDVYAVATAVGIDVDKLKKDMADGKVDKIIEANMALANEVGARGTPLYIIGDKLFPGAMQYDQMKQAVADARKAK